MKWKALSKIRANTPHIWKNIGRIGVLNEEQVLDFFEEIKEIKDAVRPSSPGDQSVDLPTAAIELRISLNCVKTLIAAGFLKFTQMENRERRILKAELQEFSRQYVSVNSIIARSGRPRKNFAYLVRKLGICPVVVPGTINPILFQKSDGELLFIASQNNTPAIRSNLTGRIATDSKMPFNENRYVTLKKASDLYEIDVEALRSLIKAGILHARKYPNLNNAIGLLKEDLENIKKDYVTTSTAGQIIGVSTKITRPILMDLGVHPVVGGPLDSACPTALYSRQALNNLVKIQTIKTEQYLTIQQVSKNLNITNSTAYELIKIGDLAVQFDSHPSLLFADREKVDQFSNTHADTVTVAKWCGVHCGQVKRLLSGMGVSPVGDVKHNGHTTFYRVIELEKAGIIYREEAGYSELSATDKPRKIRTTYEHTHLAFLKNLTPVGDICKKFDISRICFLKTFEKTKFITTITNEKKKFMTSENVEKLEIFLNEYITPSMADKIIGTSGMISRLQKLGGIPQATQLPSELKGQMFFLRSDFNKVLSQL